MAYNAPIVPGLRGRLSSEEIRDQFGLIATEFSLMPNTLGDGSQGFSEGQWDNATLNTATLYGGTVGTTTQPVVSVTAYQIFNKTSAYDSGLTTGLVGFVRHTDGKLKLWDGASVKFFADDSHNLVMGTSSTELATTAGGGFLYLSTVNGLPTGTPTSYTGAAATVIDRSNRRLSAYLAGAWRHAGFALTGSATYDPGDLADGAGEETTVTVTGAALGNFAKASFSLDTDGLILYAWVSAADTVTVRFQNESGGALNIASGTLSVSVTTV